MNEFLWSYSGFVAEHEGQREALCTLGNGYVATRGALAEAEADDRHYPGTYLAGVFNRITTNVEGREVTNESLVNAPNWLPLRFRALGGSWFSAEADTVESHDLELDLRRAVLTRKSRLRDSDGRTLSITERRFVSLSDPHLLAIESTFVPLDFSGPVQIESALDGTVQNTGVARYNDLGTDHLEHVQSHALDDDSMLLEVRTNDSGVAIAEGARTRVFDSRGERLPATATCEATERHVRMLMEIEAGEGREMIVEKVVSIYCSRDQGIYSPAVAATHAISVAEGFEELLQRHVRSWSNVWDRSRITLKGDVGHTARVLNLHIFHLLATVSKNTTEIDAGVPARGLHGEAYRGHIFWDELFIFPFLTLRVPELTRALLRYRARRLGRAREAAAAEGHEGAMFPWQSGSDGSEETQELHLNPKSGHWIPDASRLQRHINAAVVLNVWRYWQSTTDLEFMRFWGARMVLEIARFWASLATYNHALDRYEIKGVMGPDEFHEGYPDRDEPGLDNNAYTNVMAVWCLCRAFDVLEILPSTRRAELIETLGISDDELDRWGDISRKMRLCFHDDGILSQFEGYADLKELDWDSYRSRYDSIARLDRILEAEGDTPNAYKLAKQADTVMLFYVLSTDELGEIWERLGYELEPDALARNINYYEERTSHGSTLSMMVHAWLHSRLDREKSWSLFRSALESDINDVQGGTTREGIHMGAMAGTVDLIQRCYGGIETRRDVLYINPRLPEELHELAFGINYRRQNIRLEFSHDHILVRLSDDTGHEVPVAIDVLGEFVVLEPGDTFEMRLD
ncbi:MAG: glycoside hydrolase family 65 protein [Actinomycetia bacterium]|nr:glycoside hydrolase family 65 protein [Actinomycetes bacterium]